MLIFIIILMIIQLKKGAYCRFKAIICSLSQGHEINMEQPFQNGARNVVEKNLLNILFKDFSKKIIGKVTGLSLKITFFYKKGK